MRRMEVFKEVYERTERFGTPNENGCYPEAVFKVGKVVWHLKTEGGITRLYRNGEEYTPRYNTGNGLYADVSLGVTGYSLMLHQFLVASMNPTEAKKIVDNISLVINHKIIWNGEETQVIPYQYAPALEAVTPGDNKVHSDFVRRLNLFNIEVSCKDARKMKACEELGMSDEDIRNCYILGGILEVTKYLVKLVAKAC